MKRNSLIGTIVPKNMKTEQADGTGCQNRNYQNDK